MTATIQELQGALRKHIAAGLEPEEAIRRLAIQFPDAKTSDAQIAVAALTEEYDLQESEIAASLETDRAVLRLTDKAQEESGRSDMRIGEALTFLAERGDQEAQAFIDEFESPESQAFQKDFEAAVEWHPDWTKEEKEGHYRSSPGCDLDTPEKLVAAYRRAH